MHNLLAAPFPAHLRLLDVLLALLHTGRRVRQQALRIVQTHKAHVSHMCIPFYHTTYRNQDQHRPVRATMAFTAPVQYTS